LSYRERKQRTIRSIRSEMKRTMRDLCRSLSENPDVAELEELEERLLKLAKSKHELSQRVRFVT